MQFPGAAQIKHAGKRKHMRDGMLKRGETESEMATGGVSSNAESFEVEPGNGIVLVLT